MKSVFWEWTRNAAYAAAGWMLALVSVHAIDPVRGFLAIACCVLAAVLADGEAA